MFGGYVNVDYNSAATNFILQKTPGALAACGRAQVTTASKVGAASSTVTCVPRRLGRFDLEAAGFHACSHLGEFIERDIVVARGIDRAAGSDRRRTQLLRVTSEAEGAPKRARISLQTACLGVACRRD